MHHFPVKTVLVIVLIALMWFVPAATRDYETCDSPATTKKFHLIRGQKSQFDDVDMTPTYHQLLCVPTTHKAQLFIL